MNAAYRKNEETNREERIAPNPIKKTVHVMVAASEWGMDGLRYRRHRLAEFLKNQPETAEVIWLCPTPHITEDAYSSLPNGIRQFPITDIMPHKLFRFGRYMDLFYQSKLRSLLFYLKKEQQEHRIQLWFTFPGFPLLADLFPWDQVIYDCSDLWSSPIDGKKTVLSSIRQTLIANAEKRIIENADVVFCTSTYLRDKVVEMRGNAEHVYVFENGVEYLSFAEETETAVGIRPVDFTGKIVGFIGGIKPKLDFELVSEVARLRPDWLLLFVGPDGTGQSSEFQELLSNKNVLWIGSVPSAEVPKYMNTIDIGIMPYKDSPYNEAVFPLKLFEFLAAGKPVVGSNLPSTKNCIAEGIYIHLEGNQAVEFVEACDQFEKENEPKRIVERQNIARERDWHVIFTRMMETSHQYGEERDTSARG